ncbi:MAG: DUF4340 domain-containing protein [Pseudobdellovibrionaceae bacterium]
MSRGTIALLLVVVALGGYTYFFEIRGKEKAEQAKQEEAQLFKFKANEVSEFKVIFGAATKVEAKKSQGQWDILVPVEDRGDGTAIAEFLSDVVAETSKTTVKEGADIDWATFGLDNPVGKIIVKSGDVGKTVEVASKKNFQDIPYLRVSGENKVFIGTNRWSDFLGKTALQLRDRRIFRGNTSDVQKMRFIPRNKFMALSLTYKDANWSLDGHNYKLDQNMVRQFLTQVSDIRALDIEKETIPEASQLKEYGLNSPDTSVEFEMKDGTKWTASLAIVKEPTTYVISSHPAKVFRVEGLAASPILRMNKDYFRDRAEPFSFIPTDVQRIVLSTKLKKSTLANDGKEWKMENLGAELVVDQEAVKTLVQRIFELRVAQFEDKKIPLASFTNKIQFLDAQGKTLFEASWAEEEPQTKEQKEGAPKRTGMKTSLFPEPFYVDANYLATIPFQSVIADKNAVPDLKEKKQ